MIAHVLIVSILLMVSGCATLFDRVSYANMAPRLHYQGFSFNRPPNSNWYLLRSEEDYTHVTLRRGFRLESRTHTFYALVALGGLEKRPESHEEFAALARSPGQIAPYEIQRISYTQTPTSRQGQWCIRLESVDAVRRAPNAPESELKLVVRGYRCLHPAFPKTTVDFFYSERGLSEEIDPTLHQEGEQFLDGVTIDIAAGTPAAQEKLMQLGAAVQGFW